MRHVSSVCSSLSFVTETKHKEDRRVTYIFVFLSYRCKSIKRTGNKKTKILVLEALVTHAEERAVRKMTGQDAAKEDDSCSMGKTVSNIEA